jgi:hypothetical protein
VDLVTTPACGLQHRRHPLDVDARAQQRLRPGERDLQRRQMDDVSDPTAGQHALQPVHVGDVAPHELDVTLQLGVEQAPAVPTVGDVARHHVGALLDEAMDHPGPEAAQRAGDEKAFGHVVVGCSGSMPARA